MICYNNSHMGLLSMLSNFDPDEIVRKIDSVEEKLDKFIDGSGTAIDKVEKVADVVGKQASDLSQSVSSTTNNDVQSTTQTDESASQ